MRLSYAIGRLDHTLSQAIEAAIAASGLKLAQYTTLSILAAQPSLSNAQLARRAFVRPQSMNQVLAGLERQELITRRPDAEHGRIIRMELSPRGHTLLATCDRHVEALEAAMLDGLDPEERAALSRAVARATENLRAR